MMSNEPCSDPEKGEKPSQTPLEYGQDPITDAIIELLERQR